MTDPDGNVLKDADGNEIGVFTHYDMVKNTTGNGTMTLENLLAGTYHIKEEVRIEADDQANLFYGLVRTTTTLRARIRQTVLKHLLMSQKTIRMYWLPIHMRCTLFMVVKRGGEYPMLRLTELAAWNTPF